MSRLSTSFLLVLLCGIALVAIVLVVPKLRRAAVDLLPSRLYVALDAWRSDFSVDHSVRLAMPDGIELAGSLYLPDDRSTPLATILVRSPYGRLDYVESYDAGMFFARHGYAVLVQDLRGTGDSGGELLPWRDAEADGAATLDWIARQSWSNGKVGTFGCSALGETQFVLARRNHPAHAAMIPSGAGGAIGDLAGRRGYFGLYEGGVFELASGFGWFAEHGAKNPRSPAASPFDTATVLSHLPVANLVKSVRAAPTAFDDFLATPPGDAKWREWGYLADGDHLAVPAFVINSWDDQTVGDALAIAEYVRTTEPAAGPMQRVVIAPGKHCGHEDSQARAEFGNLTARGEDKPFEKWYLLWFDHWLRGAGPGLAALPPYQYFMLGENRWYSAQTWPPADAHLQQWHLTSGGHANSRQGDGVLSLMPATLESSDTYVYDPANPVPSRGGPLCCTGNPHQAVGAVDQSDVETRQDVLVYTSDPLPSDLRIAGPLSATLTFSSDALDTDLVARLADVAPDGLSVNIQEGALRLRFRTGLPPTLLVPGDRYTVKVDMRSIAYRVARGHRLRLDVTSSSFPRLERNLNTGGENSREREGRRARNTLHHGGLAYAFVDLPVLTLSGG